jgi:DNA helicase-2/ATP-dependent DNA helicase PcrA
MKDYSAYYKELNLEQRKVVDAIDGPVLVLAGPGTGKTQLLSVRAGAILKQRKAEPENILILTYTNSAVKSMKERLAKVIGPRGYDVEVGTFHSFANSIIQESEEAANYVGDKIQMDEVERVQAVEYILDHAKGIDEIRPFRAPYLYLKEILNKIGELKRDNISPKAFSECLKRGESLDPFTEEKHLKRLVALAEVYGMYEELKEGLSKDIFDERGRYDFDDMILFAQEALAKEKGLRKKYQDEFLYVMVDEYQDTNGAQLDMLFTLLDYARPNLCCVGDDDQSIYRFQGASVGNFKLLKKAFKDLKVFSLRTNYRSTRELIDISRQVIGLIPEAERMEEKSLNPARNYTDREIEFHEFLTEEEELLYIVDKVKSLKERIVASSDLTAEERAHPYNGIAILVRKRKDILKLIDAFLKAGIPYATDGKEDISGERRVRQLLDILELAHIEPAEAERKDLALYKVLTADYFEIPQADILRFIAYVMEKREREKRLGITILSEFLDYFKQSRDEIKFADRARLALAASAIERLITDARSEPIHSLLMSFIKDARIFRYILKEYSDRTILKIRELRALSSFVNMVKTSDVANPAIGLDDFMAEMKTRKDHGIPIQGDVVTMTQDGVRIFTAHGSKGQEFHSVIIPFCLQNKNWPVRPMPEKIPLPLGIFKSKELIKDRHLLKQLFLNDETRLFYVAMTRAKSSLIFTATPAEDSVSSAYLSHLDLPREAAETAEEDILVRSLESTDLKDPFIGTESVLQDLVRNMTLNPTRLNNYITCARKFLYNDVLRLPGAKKKSLVFGNCVHKALEDTYRLYKDSGSFPDFKFFRASFDNALRFQGVDAAIENHCKSAEQMAKLKGWFELVAQKPVVPLGLERKLVVTVGDGIVFTGKYDKLEWEDERKMLVRIIDYKTGKPDNHLKALEETKDIASGNCDPYLRQLVSYKLLFEKDKSESRGKKASVGALVFIEPVSADLKKYGYKKGDYATRCVGLSDNMVSELEYVIEDTWKRIKDLQFAKLPERDDDKCARCDFDSICWG